MARKAGFWKFDKEFCTRPEVEALADAMGLPAFAAGALVALLYGWALSKADDDGSINDLTVKAIEGACCWDGARGELLAAFHAAGILAGDLDGRSDDDPLRIAAWDEIADDVLTERRNATARKRAQRERDKERAAKQGKNVTQDVTRDVTQDVTGTSHGRHTDVTPLRVENRECESVCDTRAHAHTPPRTPRPNSVDEVAEFMREFASGKGVTGYDAGYAAERFCNYHDANGWRNGNHAVKDWRATARNWVLKDLHDGYGTGGAAGGKRTTPPPVLPSGAALDDLYKD